MIFSMANLIPGIAITYVGNKGEGIMEDMGMQDYYISIGDVTFNMLKNKFMYLIETEEVAKNNIRAFLATAEDKRQVLVKQIHK